MAKQKALTVRQEQLVGELTNGKHASLSAAARAVEMDPGNAHRITKYDNVAKRVDRLKTRQLDKARAGATKAASLATQILDQLQEDGVDNIGDPVTAVAVLRNLKSFEKDDRELIERFGGATKEEETLLWYRGRIRLAAARAIRYAALHPHRVDALLDRLEQQAEDYGRRLAELRASR